MHTTTKNLAILGSTGSIGTQTLEVLEGLNNKDLFNVQSMSCGSNIELFVNQIKKFRPERVCVGTQEGAREIKSIFKNLEVFYGEEGLIELADDKTLDIDRKSVV